MLTHVKENYENTVRDWIIKYFNEIIVRANEENSTQNRKKFGFMTFNYSKNRHNNLTFSMSLTVFI